MTAPRVILLTPEELAELVEGALRRALDGGSSGGRLPLSAAAEHAGTSVRVLREAIKQGELSAALLGREYSIGKSDLDVWIAGRVVGPREPRAADTHDPAARAIAQAQAEGRIAALPPTNDNASAPLSRRPRSRGK